MDQEERTERINTVIVDLISAGFELELPVMEAVLDNYYKESSCKFKGDYDTCMVNKYEKLHYKAFNEWIPEMIRYKQL